MQKTALLTAVVLTLLTPPTLSAGMLLQAAEDRPQIQFEEVSAEAGLGGYRNLFGGPEKPYIIESTGNGAAWLDYDNDGDLDLFVTNYVSFDQEYLEKVSPYCCWKELRVFCGPTGVPPDIDILYRNNSDGTFTDVTAEAGLLEQNLKSLGVVVADFDGDGWPDIYVAADSTRNALYRNRGDGTFEDLSLLSGTGYSQDGRAQSGMGVDAGDFDGDGQPDLFVTNFQDDYNTLYHNDGGFLFTDTTNEANLGQPSFTRLGWGTGFRDFDNDGHLDLFVVNGHVYPQLDAANLPETYAQQNQLFRNTGRGGFTDATPGAGEALRITKGSRGVAFADYDNDGRMDLVVVNIDDTLSLLHNITAHAHHWLTVQLIGTKSNRSGVGARLRAKVGSNILVREVQTAGSFASSNDPRAHFGLGAATKIAWLEITWPSGTIQKLENPPVDQILVVNEETGLQAQE